MNPEKNIESIVDPDGSNAAADMETDANTRYVHMFKTPVTINGTQHEKLTFDWGSLTGSDHLAIESEMLTHGKTLVTPAFTGEFLCGMAVRACTNRDKNNIRVLDQNSMKALPLRDFQAICNKARNFLLRAEL